MKNVVDINIWKKKRSMLSYIDRVVSSIKPEMEPAAYHLDWTQIKFKCDSLVFKKVGIYTRYKNVLGLLTIINEYERSKLTESDTARTKWLSNLIDTKFIHTAVRAIDEDLALINQLSDIHGLDPANLQRLRDLYYRLTVARVILLNIQGH